VPTRCRLGRVTATHDERYAAKLAEIKGAEAEASAQKGMWLSHHPPELHDRCVTVAGRPVCRRCLTLYPVGFASAVLGLLGALLWPTSLDTWLIWSLCLPATVDFVGEHLGWWRYSARRQIIVTALMAVAFGRGLSFELDERWQFQFWGPVVVFCTVWFTAAVIAARRQH
jgi:hypothetical protein